MGAGQMICFNRQLQKVFHEMIQIGREARN